MPAGDTFESQHASPASLLQRHMRSCLVSSVLQDSVNRCTAWPECQAVVVSMNRTRTYQASPACAKIHCMNAFATGAALSNHMRALVGAARRLLPGSILQPWSCGATAARYGTASTPPAHPAARPPCHAVLQVFKGTGNGSLLDPGSGTLAPQAYSLIDESALPEQYLQSSPSTEDGTAGDSGGLSAGAIAGGWGWAGGWCGPPLGCRARLCECGQRAMLGSRCSDKQTLVLYVVLRMTTEHPGPPVLPQPSTPPPHPQPPTSPHPLAFPAGIVVGLVAAGAGLVLAGRLLFRRCRAHRARPGTHGGKGQPGGPVASITAEDVAAVWGKEGSEASTDANEVLVAQLLSEAPSPQVWCPGEHAADLGA